MYLNIKDVDKLAEKLKVTNKKSPRIVQPIKGIICSLTLLLLAVPFVVYSIYKGVIHIYRTLKESDSFSRLPFYVKIFALVRNVLLEAIVICAKIANGLLGVIGSIWDGVRAGFGEHNFSIQKYLSNTLDIMHEFDENPSSAFQLTSYYIDRMDSLELVLLPETFELIEKINNIESIEQFDVNGGLWLSEYRYKIEVLNDEFNRVDEMVVVQFFRQMFNLKFKQLQELYISEWISKLPNSTPRFVIDVLNDEFKSILDCNSHSFRDFKKEVDRIIERHASEENICMWKRLDRDQDIKNVALNAVKNKKYEEVDEVVNMPSPIFFGEAIPEHSSTASHENSFINNPR